MPEDRGNPHWKNSSIKYKLVLVYVFLHLTFCYMPNATLVLRNSRNSQTSLLYYVWTVNDFGKDTDIKGKKIKSLISGNIG